MAASSEEFKFAQQIEKYTERIGMDYPITVFRCLSRNSSVQANMFDLVLSFLSAWAFKYSEGSVKPEHKIYRICEMSYRMMQVVRSDEDNRPVV